jgi:LAO/AO transport system kinase
MGASGPAPTQPREDRKINLRKTARTISAIERGDSEIAGLLREAWRLERTIPVIGFSGPPGAGKSTLVDQLAMHWAERSKLVAVLAVDPASPFTGGAVLGDRFRMDRASSHPNVFVRSLSSRGHLGGLSSATADIVRAMGPLGFDVVLLETVGAGQSDVAVANLADAVIVLSVPGLGDQIQASKAGILEIADVYAVNKSDLPGADTVAGHLRANLDLIYPGKAGRNMPTDKVAASGGNAQQHERHGSPKDAKGFWKPPVLKVNSSSGQGVGELAAEVEGFLAWSCECGNQMIRHKKQLEARVLEAAEARLLAQCMASAHAGGVEFSKLIGDVAAATLGPDDAAELLVRSFLDKK